MHPSQLVIIDALPSFIIKVPIHFLMPPRSKMRLNLSSSHVCGICVLLSLSAISLCANAQTTRDTYYARAVGSGASAASKSEGAFIPGEFGSASASFANKGVVPTNDVEFEVSASSDVKRGSLQARSQVKAIEIGNINGAGAAPGANANSESIFSYGYVALLETDDFSGPPASAPINFVMNFHLSSYQETTITGRRSGEGGGSNATVSWSIDIGGVITQGSRYKATSWHGINTEQGGPSSISIPISLIVAQPVRFSLSLTSATGVVFSRSGIPDALESGAAIASASLTYTGNTAPGGYRLAYVGSAGPPESLSLPDGPPIFTPTRPGDFDANSQVDGTDFLLWQRTFGSQVAPPGSWPDPDGSGFVDVGDLNTWKQHFGTSPESMKPVPEPGFPAIVFLLGLASASRQHRLMHRTMQRAAD